MCVVPGVNVSLGFAQFVGQREIYRRWSKIEGARQGVAANRNWGFAMRENRHDSMRTERGERARFQDHARPHFPGAKVIEEAE
jgi:hypothetical protein